MLYFSYGSNMSIQRLKDRVSSARIIAAATLYGHALRFHKRGKDGSGKCDAFETRKPKDFVIGVVFEISEADKAKLDRLEGVGYGYENKTITLSTALGHPLQAVTYYATNINPQLKPFHWYKHHVLTGARENELPRDYLERIKIIESITDPDPRRSKREMSIYTNS